MATATESPATESTVSEVSEDFEIECVFPGDEEVTRRTIRGAQPGDFLAWIDRGADPPVNRIVMVVEDGRTSERGVDGYVALDCVDPVTGEEFQLNTSDLEDSCEVRCVSKGVNASRGTGKHRGRPKKVQAAPVEATESAPAELPAPESTPAA